MRRNPRQTPSRARTRWPRAWSSKREIAAGRDVAFWLDKAYTHLDNGLLDEADITEVETLAQEYYDALDAASDVTSENAETNEQIKNDA